MLKAWTPARARGTSTAQREPDTSGKKMRAPGMMGCAHLAADAPWVKGWRPTGVPEGGNPAQQHMLLHHSAAPRCPVLAGVLRPDPAYPTTGHQHSWLGTGCPHSARVRGSSSDPPERALLKAAVFTPSGLWPGGPAATHHTLWLAPCSGNTQIKSDTSHTPQEHHVPAQGLAGPKKLQLTQHHQHCKVCPASLVGKHLLGCSDIIHPARLVNLRAPPSVPTVPPPLCRQPNRRWSNLQERPGAGTYPVVMSSSSVSVFPIRSLSLM